MNTIKESKIKGKLATIISISLLNLLLPLGLNPVFGMRDTQNGDIVSYKLVPIPVVNSEILNAELPDIVYVIVIFTLGFHFDSSLAEAGNVDCLLTSLLHFVTVLGKFFTSKLLFNLLLVHTKQRLFFGFTESQFLNGFLKCAA